MSGLALSKGDVWQVELDPVRGHEQGRTRPCVIVSDNWFNRAQRGVVVIVPLTSRLRGIPLHVVVQPPEGGLRVPSAVKIEDVRSVSVERLTTHYGTLSPATLAAIEERLRILFGL